MYLLLCMPGNISNADLTPHVPEERSDWLFRTATCYTSEWSVTVDKKQALRKQPALKRNLAALSLLTFYFSIAMGTDLSSNKYRQAG